MYEATIFTENHTHVIMLDTLEHIEIRDGVVVTNTPSGHAFIIPVSKVEYIDVRKEVDNV